MLKSFSILFPGAGSSPLHCVNGKQSVSGVNFYMKNEIWKDCPDFEGWYLVSNYGRFKRIMPAPKAIVGRLINPSVQRQGYLLVDLSIKGISKKFIAHRMVARAFIPNPENKPQVNHKDGIKSNNHVSNLEWVTASENVLHSFRIGLEKPMQGESHHQAKLTNKDVFMIRKLLKNGVRNKDLAKRYSVDRNSITNIKSGKTWVHI